MTKVNEDMTAEEILVSITEPRKAEKMRQRRTDDEWQMQEAERHQHDSDYSETTR
jgi:hypothetical protein